VTTFLCQRSSNVYQTQTHIQWLGHHAMTGVHSECRCCKCETPRCRSHESCALKIPSQFDAEGFHCLTFPNNANTINDGHWTCNPVRSGVSEPGELHAHTTHFASIGQSMFKRKADARGRLRPMLCKLVYGWKGAIRRLNAVSKGARTSFFKKTRLAAGTAQ
jgi:hypothetical protein